MNRILARLLALPPAVRATALYGFGIFWAKGLGLALVPILTANLSPAEFGRLELLSSAAEIGGLLVGAGLLETLFRFASVRDQEGRRNAANVYGLTLAISAIAFGSLMFAAPWLAGLVPLGASASEMRLLGLAIAIDGAITIPLGWLRMQDRAATYVALTCGRAALQVAAVGILVSMGHGVWGVLAGGALSAVMIAVVLAARTGRSAGISFDPRAWSGLLAYGLPLVAAGLASFVLGSADRWMLAGHAAAASLGHYALAAKFASMSSFLIQPFELWWAPRRIRALSDEGGIKRSATVADAGGALALLSCGAAAVVGPAAIHLLTPAAYHPAATLVPWIAACLLAVAFGSLTNVGCYLGRSSFGVLGINVASAAIALAGYFLLIPTHGVPGAIAATLVAQVSRTLMSLAVSRRRVRIPHRWSAIGLVALPVAAAAAAPQLASGPLVGLTVGFAGLAAGACAAVALRIFPSPFGARRATAT